MIRPVERSEKFVKERNEYQNVVRRGSLIIAHSYRQLLMLYYHGIVLHKSILQSDKSFVLVFAHINL